jgi:hypothetical protein
MRVCASDVPYWSASRTGVSSVRNASSASSMTAGGLKQTVPCAPPCCRAPSKRRLGTILLACRAARSISEAEVTKTDAETRARQDRLLAALQTNPGDSLAELARKLEWFYRDGGPNKSLVDRTLKALKGRGLVRKEGGEWVPTGTGKKGGKSRFKLETIQEAT